MKHDLYDLFWECGNEVKELKEEPCNTDRILELVMRKAGKSKIRQTKRKRMILLSAVAALIAVSGVTVAAASEKFELFRNILSRSEISECGSFPRLDLDEKGSVEQNLWEETVLFEGNDKMQVSTVCMYHDSNILMVTLALKLQDGQTLPEDACVVPYFYRNTESGEELITKSDIAGIENLVQGEEVGTYYLTYYLTEPDISGSTISVKLKNIYTQEQIDACFDYVVAQQEIWRQELGADGMTDEKWKQLWQEQNLDARTQQTEWEYLETCTPLLEGEWTAELHVPKAAAEPLVVDGENCRMTVDSLSVLIEYDKQADYNCPVILTTMQDGTTLCTDLGTNEKEWLNTHGVDTEHLRESVYSRGTTQGRIQCYDCPYPVEEIAGITVYTFTYDTTDPDGYALNATSEAVYEKE